MGSLSDEIHDFLDANPVGVLATEATDGRPRQSLVYFACDGDELLISTLTDRHKARDVRRTGWASLCVIGHEPPYPSATFSGLAEIRTEHIGPSTARIMQRISGADGAAGADERRRAGRRGPGDPRDRDRPRQRGQLHRAGHGMSGTADRG